MSLIPKLYSYPIGCPPFMPMLHPNAWMKPMSTIPQSRNYFTSRNFLRRCTATGWPKHFPAFKQALDLNYVGGSPNTEVPVVLFHGEADTIVTPDTYDRFVARLCNLGKNVNYKLYPEVDHFQTRQASFVDLITWMRNILVGQLPESQCSAFFASKIE